MGRYSNPFRRRKRVGERQKRYDELATDCHQTFDKMEIHQGNTPANIVMCAKLAVVQQKGKFKRVSSSEYLELYCHMSHNILLFCSVITVKTMSGKNFPDTSRK